MSEFAGAIDLSEFKGTLGPQQAEALMGELREVTRTREIALREWAAAEADAEGLRQLLGVLAYFYGDKTTAGARELQVSAATIKHADDQIVSFGIVPGDNTLTVTVTVRVDGEWNIGSQPTDQERSELDIYEELPEVVTRPDAFKVIVNTKKGLRVAEWTPKA